MSEKSPIISNMIKDIKEIKLVLADVVKVLYYLKAKSDINTEERFAKIEREAPREETFSEQQSELDRIFAARGLVVEETREKIIETNDIIHGDKIEVVGTFKHETEKAFLILSMDTTKEMWIPKSIIDVIKDNSVIIRRKSKQWFIDKCEWKAPKPYGGCNGNSRRGKRNIREHSAT